jgi:hypothetical protein
MSFVLQGRVDMEPRPTGTLRSRPRVVTLLPRGEAIRNFVYSGSLQKLSQNVDITVLSVIPSAELRELLSAGPFSLQPLRSHREQWPVRFAREILDMSHGRHLWSKAAQERWMLRDHDAQTVPQKFKRLTRKACSVPFANTTGLELLSKFERSLSRMLATTDEFLNLYKAIQPEIVFNSSHVHSVNAIQAVQAAQWLGIPTATFIFSWDNLTSQGRIIPAYDYYLVWNDDIRKQLLRIYPSVRPDQVVVTGTPQFDFHFRPEYHQSREAFCQRVGADSSREIVLYSTGMANHMPGEEKIVEGIADLLKKFPSQPQLLVRVYPKDLTGRFESLKQRRPDILFPVIPWESQWLTPKVEDLALLTNTLRHCAAGINIASTVSLELCMMDKPVINVGYNPPGMDIHPISFARYYGFDHYEPVVRSGAVEVAYSEQELESMLSAALVDPQRRAGDRRAFLQRMFGDTLDGRSAERIATILETIASKGRDRG